MLISIKEFGKILIIKKYCIGKDLAYWTPLPSSPEHGLLRQRVALWLHSLLVPLATTPLRSSTSIDASCGAYSSGRPPCSTGWRPSSKSDQESVSLQNLILILQFSHRSQLAQKALLYLLLLVSCIGICYVYVAIITFLYRSTPFRQAVGVALCIVMFLFILGILKIFSILSPIQLFWSNPRVKRRQAENNYQDTHLQSNTDLTLTDGQLDH